MEQYKSSKKGICQNSIHGVDEACESDSWTQSDGSRPEEDPHLHGVGETDFCVSQARQKKASGSERKLLSTLVLSSVPQAGRNEMKKGGKVTVSWRTDLGAAKRPTFKVGRVSRTLISVDRLQKTGQDVILSKKQPRSVNMRTVGTMSLRREKIHVHSGHVELGVDE